MRNVEENLNKVYFFVEGYVKKNGFPPSVREICAKLNIKSTATAYSYLEKLKDKGLIVKTSSKNRALKLNKDEDTPFMAPLIGTITAGQPIFAVENFEGYYPLPQEFSSEKDTFVLSVKGESMIQAGIFNGDKIIVKKQNTAENGDIVVALLEDSATVKRFFKRDNHIVLHPENPTMEDIIAYDVIILGKVVGLIRKF